MNQPKLCCQCGSQGPLTRLHGYPFCPRCASKLGLHADKTILRNAERYAASKSISYEEEVVARLASMEKRFIKTKVQLLHILERLTELT